MSAAKARDPKLKCIRASRARDSIPLLTPDSRPGLNYAAPTELDCPGSISINSAQSEFSCTVMLTGTSTRFRSATNWAH